MKNKYGWDIRKLGDFIEQVRGVSYKPSDLSSELSEEYIPLLRANNIQDELHFNDMQFVSSTKVSKKQLLKSGDILICTSSGSKHLVGKAAQVKADYKITFGAFCKIIRPINLDSRFLGHYFKSNLYRNIISDLSRGANINNIKNEDIDSLKIPIPPLPAQHQIVSELDALSDIITKKKQQLEELDTLAQATFYDMFGDPVNNEKDWEVDSINNISKIRIGPFGSLLHVEDYIVNGTPLVNPSHMSNGMIIPDYNLTVSSEKIKELSSYLLKEGDLIVGRRGDIGRCALVTEKEDGFICGTGSLYIRFNSKINPIYALKTFSSKSMVLKLQEKAKGATMLNINAGSVGSLPFPIPPLKLQNKFIQKIESIEKQKKLISKSIDDVQQLFDYTMDKYFN